MTTSRTLPREAAPGADDWPLDRVGRDLAIPALGEAPWGTHFCEFYGVRQDLVEVLVPYFRAGLENNERCVWVARDPLDVDDATEVLGRALPDFDRRLASGQMMLVQHGTWSCRDGVFESDVVLSRMRPSIAEALAQGYSGRRLAGLVTPDQDPRGWDSLMAYEEAIGPRLEGHRGLGLCIYPLQRCDSVQLLDVLVRHRFALIKYQDWTLIEPSERKRATEAVQRMNDALAARTEQLQAALADLRGFSRWVSHDLRAPLQAVTSFGELLAETSRERLTEDEWHLLERIRHHAARMDRLITDILAYSMAQRAAIRAEALDMEALARDVCDSLADAAERDGVRLQVDAMPPAHGDPGTIAQVLANLVGNAVKFCRRTPGAQVWVGSTVRDGAIVYYVRDNGPGFDMAQADRAFGAFERLHRTSRFEGTGLGLAIVKEIVTRHGGRVWAESSRGNGATFLFTLPHPGGAGAPPEAGG